MIFQDYLVHKMEEGERVEMDDGYVGSSPRYVKCPKCIGNLPERREMQQRVRSRHETVNRRFKQFAILRQEFRHDITLHACVFVSIAVLTQISIENGDKLFSINEYGN